MLNSVNRWAFLLWPDIALTVAHVAIVAAVAAIAMPLLRKSTPVFRHALLTVVLVKHVTPPTLISPTSVFRVLPAPDSAIRFAEARGPENLSPAASVLTYWALGTAIVVAYAVAEALWRRWRLRHAASVTDPEACAALERACAGLGLRRRPSLCSVPNATPAIVGLVAPRVVIPHWALRLPRHDVEALIAHEVAHLRRYDPYWRIFILLVQALWWWNPLTWWVCAKVRHEMESAADGLVVACGLASPAWYASTLVDVAERVERRNVTARWLGLGESFHPLKLRLRRILDGRTARRRLNIRHGIALLVIALLVIPYPPSAVEGPNPPPRTFRYPPRAHRDMTLPEALQKTAYAAKIVASGSLGDDGRNSLCEMPACECRG